MSALCQKRTKRPPCGGLSAWCQPAALNRQIPGHRHQPVAGPALLHIHHGRERDVKALHHHFLACGHIVDVFPRLDRLLLVGVEHKLPVRIACEQRRGAGSDVGLHQILLLPDATVYDM